MRHKIPNIVIIHIGLESYVSHVLKYYKIICMCIIIISTLIGGEKRKKIKRGERKEVVL